MHYSKPRNLALAPNLHPQSKQKLYSRYNLSTQNVVSKQFTKSHGSLGKCLKLSLGQKVYKRCLGHVLVPERKEAIRNYGSVQKDKGANLKRFRRDKQY